jgi:hypothetical protein
MPHVPAHDFQPFQDLSAFTFKAALAETFPDDVMETLPLELHAAHEEWQQWCMTASEDDIVAFFNGGSIGSHPLQHWIFTPPLTRLFSMPGAFSRLGDFAQGYSLRLVPFFPGDIADRLGEHPDLLEAHAVGPGKDIWSTNADDNIARIRTMNSGHLWSTEPRSPVLDAWLRQAADRIALFKQAVANRVMLSETDPRLVPMGMVLDRVNPATPAPPETIPETTCWLKTLADAGWKADPARLSEPAIRGAQKKVREMLAVGLPNGETALEWTRLLDGMGFLSLTAIARHHKAVKEVRGVHIWMTESLIKGTADLLCHEIEVHGATLEEVGRPLLYLAAQESPEESARLLDTARKAGMNMAKVGWPLLIQTFGPPSTWPFNLPANMTEGAVLFTRIMGRLFPGGLLPDCPAPDRIRSAQWLANLPLEENLPFLDALMKAGFDLTAFDNPTLCRVAGEDLSLLLGGLQSRRKKTAPVVRAFLDAQRTHHPARLQLMVDVRGLKGATAFHWAARTRELAVFDLLLEAGADPLVVDDAGNTLAHWLMRKYSPRHEKDFIPALQWLQNHGVDLLAPNNKGQTPMAKLAEKGTVDSLMALVGTAGSAVVKTRDNQGKTAMDVLEQRTDRDTVLPVIEQVVLEDSLPNPDKAPATPRRRL